MSPCMLVTRQFCWSYHVPWNPHVATCANRGRYITELTVERSRPSSLTLTAHWRLDTAARTVAPWSWTSRARDSAPGMSASVKELLCVPLLLFIVVAYGVHSPNQNCGAKFQCRFHDNYWGWRSFGKHLLYVSGACGCFQYMKLPKCMYTVALNSIIICQPPGWVMSATGEGIVVLLCRAPSVEQLGMGK